MYQLAYHPCPMLLISKPCYVMLLYHHIPTNLFVSWPCIPLLPERSQHELPLCYKFFHCIICNTPMHWLTQCQPRRATISRNIWGCVLFFGPCIFLWMCIVLLSTTMNASECTISFAPQYIKNYVKVCWLFIAQYLIIIVVIRIYNNIIYILFIVIMI